MSVALRKRNWAAIASSVMLLVQGSISCAGEAEIRLAANFKLERFADEHTKNGNLLRGARFMAFDAGGNLYVTTAKGDKVLMLPDVDKNGAADDVTVVADKLNAPQGLVFADGALLVANQDGVVKLKQENGRWSQPQPFITGLPTGGHKLKNIKLGADGYLYINIGSSCNVCIERDPLRATILRYTLAGKPAGALAVLGRHQQSAIWASGLRNSQGFAWHPQTGDMYATNNGADNRSGAAGGKVNDELPPEHLNKIEAGKHYGWPYCWADPRNLNGQLDDLNFKAEAGFCSSVQAPAITFTSHTTPIGITFLDKTNWPAEYKTDAIVALHGSWNREKPAGYKLVRVKFSENKPVAVEDFATGWLAEGAGSGLFGSSRVNGRPVDVAVGYDGALYVSDDQAGAIYRISYQNKEKIK